MKIKCYLRKTTGAFANQEKSYPVVYNAHRIEADTLFSLMENNCRVSSGMAKMVIDALASEIQRFTLMGHAVYVPQLGTFSPRIKSKVGIDSKGQAKLVKPKAEISFSPSSEYLAECKKAKFQLVDHSPMDCKTLADEEAIETANKILDEKQFFMQEEFATRCNVSRGNASKVLARLVESGILAVNYYGRSKIYFKPDEKSDSSQQGEEFQQQNVEF